MRVPGRGLASAWAVGLLRAFGAPQLVFINHIPSRHAKSSAAAVGLWRGSSLWQQQPCCMHMHAGPVHVGGGGTHMHIAH